RSGCGCALPAGSGRHLLHSWLHGHHASQRVEQRARIHFCGRRGAPASQAWRIRGALARPQPVMPFQRRDRLHCGARFLSLITPYSAESTMSDYTLWSAAQPIKAPVAGSTQRLPVHRIFCVGRNYHAHAVEMGRPVDKSVERAFYFSKSPQALIETGAKVAYPPETSNYHYEMELVLVIGKEGFRIAQEQAHEHVFGYACGLDMTRRDLQLVARDKCRPWDLGKDFEQSAVISPVVPTPGKIIEEGEIALSVNGEQKQ